MRNYKLEEPRAALAYTINTRITKIIAETEGEWFVHVVYETNEELAFREIIYGPCESFIMAVLCEDELRVMHRKAMAALLEQLHTEPI